MCFTPICGYKLRYNQFTYINNLKITTNSLLENKCFFLQYNKAQVRAQYKDYIFDLSFIH